jgi:hypothetical protein
MDMIRTINVQTTGLFSQCNTICHPTHGMIPKAGAPPHIGTTVSVPRLSKLTPAD